VDWVKKTIKYKVHGQEVILKGIKTNLQQREPVSLVELQGTSSYESTG
jgi:hypothetical protein